MAGYFSFGYVAWIYFSWFFLYMAQVRGFDLKASARYAMLPFLSMTVCCLAGGAGALYLSQSSFWSVSVDIAGRNSGVFSSMVNMGGQIGGAVTASLTPWIAQRFGWTTSFAIAAALAVMGAICWLTVHPERPLDI